MASILVGKAANGALVHLLPGDPLTAIIGDRAIDPAAEAALRARWGVDRPLLTVLADLSAMLGGALGAYG